jgi:hypothetical protein
MRTFAASVKPIGQRNEDFERAASKAKGSIALGQSIDLRGDG